MFKQGHIKKGGGFNYHSTKSWYPKPIDNKLNKFILRKGDVLMAMTDMKDNVAILGNTALMDTDNKYIVNQRVCLLRSKDLKSISSYFIYLLTNNKVFVKNLRKRANYSVQVNLSTEAIKESRIYIPTKEINDKFNNIIEPYFNLISKYNMEIQCLYKLRDTLLPKLMLENCDSSSDKLSFIYVLIAKILTYNIIQLQTNFTKVFI